MIWDR